MLRHSPLPPFVLGSALALGIALADSRVPAQTAVRPPAPVGTDGGLRTGEPTPPLARARKA